MLIVAGQICRSQISIRITDLPRDTPENTRIFMAGSLNSWNPADPAFELKKNLSNNYYEIIIPEGSGTFEYKFTQGSWETAESGQNGNPAPNRMLAFSGKPQNIEAKIFSWTKPTEKTSTASRNVKILSENFSVPQLNTTRRIWIYLPRDYGKSRKKYPVIYMPDGQNIFDEGTSFSGEWRADETLDSLSHNRNFEAIIVGIDNGGTERLNEYSPWKNGKYGGGKGDLWEDQLF